MSDDVIATLVKEREGCKAVMLVINLSSETYNVTVTEADFDTLSAVLNTNEEEIMYSDGVLTVPGYSIAVLTQGE